MYFVCQYMCQTLQHSICVRSSQFSFQYSCPGTWSTSASLCTEVVCAIKYVVDNPGVDAEVSKLPELCPGQGNVDFPALPLLFHCA